MFSLPSIWNILVSTVVFIVAAWYLRRYLDEQGIPHSMARGLVVFVLAYIASWGSGEATDWLQLKLGGTTQSAQPASPNAAELNMTKLMQQLEQQK